MMYLMKVRERERGRREKSLPRAETWKSVINLNTEENVPRKVSL